MKKLVNSKNVTQKILVAILLVLTLNFIVPNYSQADMGGVLLKPITDLFSLLGDGVCAGLQYFLVDGKFLPTDGSILTAFLISSKEVGNYPEIAYNAGAGGKEYQFYTDDLDIEGWDWLNGVVGNEQVVVPVTKYTPEAIFSGKVPALDIDFINPDKYQYNAEEQERSVAYQLHSTVATWYVALRNLAIVGLMVVLVYVGIRIVISSTASDKAKYKQMMMDWVVAMCLLFCLHYIMSFTITITEEITKGITGISNTVNTIPVTVYKGSSGSSDVLVQFNTSLTGLARFQTRMDDGGTRLLYTIIYMALVIYTVMFTFTYLKRVITMAFLTLISPLVALTYPIDKINDGKAQAFNSWLKEYIFNALLQPFHLIIYTVFVGSAMGLASTNPIYAIVALAFITPAEKILRKFFGFEKASTAGTLGAFASMAGGAAAYRMLGNAVNRRGGKGSKGGNGGNNIRTQNNRQLEDPNAPSGVDGFTGHNNATSLGDNTNNRQNNNLDRSQETLNTHQTPQQAMLDVYDEGFGTNSWDAQERDAMAREAYQPEGMNYSADEYAQILRDTGYEESEIPAMLADAGYRANNTAPQGGTDTANTNVDTDTNTTNTNRSFGARVWDGVKGSGRAIANKASTTIGNKHWVGQKLKNAGVGMLKGGVHVAARAAAAVPTAMVGLAAGIAGDNLEDILTYGIGGATLGATVLGNSAVNTVDSIGRGINSTVVQGFTNGFTGTTSMERQIARQERQLQADPAFMQQVNEQYADGNLGGKELKQATERAAKLVSYGVNPEKLGKTLKVEDSIMADLANSQMSEEEKKQLAREQATTAAKMAEKIKNPEALVGQKGEELQARWAEQIKNKNTGLTNDEAKANAKEMMQRVRKIKGV